MSHLKITMRPSNNNQLFLGQSLFEVVFAVGIAALIITGIVSLANKTLGNSNQSKDRALASRYASDMTECLRQLRDDDFETFVSSGEGTCEPLVNGTQFDGDITISSENPPDNTIYEVLVVVSWTDGTGTHDVQSITRLSDWKRR